MKATIKNIRERGGRYGEAAHCHICGAMYSVTPGDYWYAKDSTTLRCCDSDCEIVREETRIVPVK